MDKKKKKDKNKDKADGVRPRSKTTVAASKDAAVVQQKDPPLEEDVEGLKKQIAELKTNLESCVKTVSLREEERNKAIEDLNFAKEDLHVATLRAATYKSDFEEERKDRERLHQECEELKRRETPEFTAILEAELKKKKEECEELNDRLSKCEANSKMFESRVAILQEALAASKRMIEQKTQDYHRELSLAAGKLEEKRQEIMELNKTIQSHEKQKEGPEQYFTIKDQLDIAELTCKNLHRDQQKAAETMKKLEQENKELRAEYTSVCEERDRLLQSREQLSRQVMRGQRGRYYENLESQDGYNYGPGTCAFNNVSGHTDVELNAQNSRQRDFKANRSASDGEVAEYRLEHWELDRDRVHAQHHVPSSEVNFPGSQPVGRRTYNDERHFYERPTTQTISETTQYPSLSHDDGQIYTRALGYISLEIGELSEHEMSSLKEIVENWNYSVEEELDNDIKLMCDKMRELRHDDLVERRTNLHMSFDPNLTCPNCKKQFREGDVQKLIKHAKNCRQKS